MGVLHSNQVLSVSCRYESDLDKVINFICEFSGKKIEELVGIKCQLPIT